MEESSFAIPFQHATRFFPFGSSYFRGFKLNLFPHSYDAYSDRVRCCPPRKWTHSCSLDVASREQPNAADNSGPVVSPRSLPKPFQYWFPGARLRQTSDFASWNKNEKGCGFVLVFIVWRVCGISNISIPSSIPIPRHTIHLSNKHPTDRKTVNSITYYAGCV